MSTWTLHATGGPVHVRSGPALLSGIDAGPSLARHEARWGALPRPSGNELLGLCESVDIRGRGGAGFPFARKVSTMLGLRGRPVVVVNLSEGEPGSLKDGVLAEVAPHLILDGAAATAHALGTDELHLLIPEERPEVGLGIRRALAERADRDRGLRWQVHTAADRFVSGEASAVIERIEGRPGLPVTTWKPAAIAGVRGKPTMLSNGETFAHVGRLVLAGPTTFRAFGTVDEPGTTLLTVDGDRVEGRAPTVMEVPLGTPYSDVLPDVLLSEPVLLGGYHGVWAAPDALRSLQVSRASTVPAGLAIGAGIVLPLTRGCPVHRTGEITAYLAGQSAQRCGPCLNGLPALAAAVDQVVRGYGGTDEVVRLTTLVERRGACAHPDGTIRLVRSMLTVFAGEVTAHAHGRCDYAGTTTRRLEVTA